MTEHTHKYIYVHVYVCMYIDIHTYIHTHVCVCVCVCIQLLLFSCKVVSDSFSTPWTVAYQAPLSIGYPKQEDWNGLPLPFLGYLTNLGIKPLFPTLSMSLALQANSLPLSHQGSLYIHTYINTYMYTCVCVCVSHSVLSSYL